MLGTSVGPYQILEKLGSGGMGEVFLGHDPRLERRVALKCLTSAASMTADGHARVLREARAVARLTHPHIAGVYDVLEQDGRAFIVMEYVEGVSLAAHLASGPLPASEVRLIGRQLASALAAAHAQGVIHRDLKPANIQVMRDGSIKVLDFGVARLMPAMQTVVDTTIGDPLQLHSLGGNPGTPIYMAPEQLIGHLADARTDIYSAGVILFQMATGRRPYLDTTAVTLALAMNADPAPAARAINPLVPLELSEAIGKALKRNPDHRYQSARELDSALASMSGTASSTRSVNAANATGEVLPRWPRRSSTVAAAAAIALIAAAVAWRPVMHRLGFTSETAAITHPSVLAILPVDNPGGDPQAGYLGAGVVSVMAENLASIPGLTVLPRASTAAYEQKRNDLIGLQKELGAAYVLDMGIRTASPRAQIVARLRRPGSVSPVWEQSFEGDTLVVEKALLQAVGVALEQHVLPRPLTAVERTRLLKLPTTSGPALVAYSEARALMDRSDVPGNLARAIELLSRATSTDPQFAVAYAALGDALWRRYQVDKRSEVATQATAAVMEALRIDPDLAPVHQALGNMQFQTGRNAEAITSLRRALAIQPDSDDSHRLLGRVMAASGNIEAGVAELHRAIELRPYWNNYYSLGYVLYAAGRYQEALEALHKTTELQPNFSGAYQMLGTTYHMLGDVTQAIGNYEHAARLGPNVSAYANLALAYYAAKRYGEARDAYLEAIKRDASMASLRRDLGDVYTRLGRDRDARGMYEKAIALARDELTVNPRDADAVVLIALCEAKTGRRAEAERHAAEAAVLAPTSRDVRIRVAKVYAALNDKPSGLSAVQTAVTLGYEPKMLQNDDELDTLRGSAQFTEAVAAGLAARNDISRKGVGR